MKMNKRERMLKEVESLIETRENEEFHNKNLFIFIGGEIIGDYGLVGTIDNEGIIKLDDVRKYTPILKRIAERCVRRDEESQAVLQYYNIFIDDDGVYFYIGRMVRNTNTIQLMNNQLVMLGHEYGLCSYRPYYFSKYLSNIILSSGYVNRITDSHEMLALIYDDGHKIELGLHERVKCAISDVKRMVKMNNIVDPVLVITDEHDYEIARYRYLDIRDSIQDVIKYAMTSTEFPSFEVI